MCVCVCVFQCGMCVWYVCVRFTLCPQLRDFDHIGQLLLSGRGEMSEMFLCVSAGSHSDILHGRLDQFLLSAHVSAL